MAVVILEITIKIGNTVIKTEIPAQGEAGVVEGGTATVVDLTAVETIVGETTEVETTEVETTAAVEMITTNPQA